MNIWINIPRPIYINGYITKYAIDIYGNVFNTKRKKYITWGIDSYGYPKVGLYLDRIRYTMTIHKIVMNTFNPTNDKGMQINHIDGNKLNPYIENLEWCTASDNIVHAFATGLKKPIVGEENNFTKYTEAEIREVCEMLEAGKSSKYIVSHTRIPKTYITDIRTGKKWKHITKEYDIHQTRIAKFKGFDEDTKSHILYLRKSRKKPKEICGMIGIPYTKIHKTAITNLYKKL